MLVPRQRPIFATKFEDFVAAVRRDFGQPDLPFYYVQIGRHVAATNRREWNAVQEAQRILEGKLANTGVVTGDRFAARRWHPCRNARD